MILFELETYTSRLRLIGTIALLISIATWTLDLTGLVYECPFCRTQRTVIGLLGVILMLPNPHFWVARYVGSVFAFLGAHVAAAQNFAGWRRISAGEFEFNDPVYTDSFLLSGCALFIIAGLTWLLLFAPDKPEDSQGSA